MVVVKILESVFARERVSRRSNPCAHLKPFAKQQKNHSNDTLAICEAAIRLGIHRIAVKTLDRQHIKTLRTVRRRPAQQRTATGNQIGAIPGEYGLPFPIGLRRLIVALPDALKEAQNGLSPIARATLAQSLERLRKMDRVIDGLTKQITQICKKTPRYADLHAIPGMGPLVSGALISEIGAGRQFSNGRQMADWLGLVSRQHSSRGKQVLESITNHGSNDLRVLLVHAARAVFRFAQRRLDPLGEWIRASIPRRGRHRAIDALAKTLPASPGRFS